MILSYTARSNTGALKKYFVNLDYVSIAMFSFNPDVPHELDYIMFEVPGEGASSVSWKKIVNTDPKPADRTDEEHAQAALQSLYMKYQEYIRSKAQVLPQA